MARKARPLTKELSPFAKYAKARRLELELSMEAVAGALGTSHSIISQLEGDPAYSLNKRHFEALARILQTDMDTLLELDGLKAPKPGKPSRLQQDAINLILRMPDTRARLARSLLRTLLEDDTPEATDGVPQRNNAQEA